MLAVPDNLLTDRLALRPYKEVDRDAFLALLADEQASSFLKLTPEQRTPDGAAQIFDFTIESYGTGSPLFALAIADRDSDELIGLCALAPTGYDSEEVECFYSLASAHWQQGLALEAARGLFEYAFEQLNVQRIVAHIDPDNRVGCRAAERVGMVFTGLAEHPDQKDIGRRYVMTRG
jgi:ribosomal-protein-alanine N-acetyltransferase